MKKLANRSILLMITSFFAVLPAVAQYQVSGRILDEVNNLPLEAANVVLTTSDSVYVTGTTCNNKGTFQIKNMPAGNYLIKTSYLGYTTRVIAVNSMANSIDLGDIFMNEETNLLEGVTVTASSVTNTADRLIVFVTDQQKALSSNGLNLLAGMQLPRLIVNPLTNEVKLPGEEKILFCINGVKVNNDDVRALQPDDIIRIEYLDNPGVRYDNADVVINYVLKRAFSGGAVSLDLTNAVTTSFGDDQVSARFNHKRSEFGLSYSIRYRNPDKVGSDEESQFNFADGSTMTRFSKGGASNFKEDSHNIALNYSLLDENKYYFNATVRHSISIHDKMRRSEQYTLANPTDITNVHQGTDMSEYLPSIDLYYSRSLKKKQTIVLNLVGTYIKSDINQKYEEIKNNQPIADIISDVDGKKYSIIGEGIYEKIFNNSNRFTAGLKHTQSFTNNDYTGTVNNTTEMDQADTYIYSEYAGKLDKFSYIGGVGLSRSWAKQKGEDEYSYYTFRPKITLQYNFTRNMFLRLKGEIYNSSPSLSQLSAVDQYIDTLQIKRGNPSLEPHLNYTTNLTFGWRKGIYGINFNTSYQYSPDAIMADIFRENNMFVHAINNQKSWQKLNSEVTLNAGPIKKILMLSFTGGVNRYISRGNTYAHTYTNFYYRAQATVMYKKFVAMFQAMSSYDTLMGETMHEGEDMHLCMLMYNSGKFTVGAGVMLPFSKEYKRYSEVRNAYVPSKINAYSNDFSQMVLLKFSWNFNYGRKAKTANKRFNNQDRDSGIMQAN